jgi:hypothetical protein
MNNFRAAEGGYAGEAKTIALLSDDFWHLRRSVDAGGVDLILQAKSAHTPDAINDRFDRLAFVQSKQFQRGGRATLDACYVESPSGPRAGYFVFAHSFGDEGEPLTWCFSAQEVICHWRHSEERGVYVFDPRHHQDGAKFARRSRDEVRSMIEEGMFNRGSQIVGLIRDSFFEAYSNVRDTRTLCGGYLLLRPAGCWSVYYRSSDGNSVTPLDLRRDIFPYSGHFAWGYRGTGPRFLAYSLLTHFFGGRRPTEEEVNRLVTGLLSQLDSENEHQLSSEMILLSLDHCQ